MFGETLYLFSKAINIGEIPSLPGQSFGGSVGPCNEKQQNEIWRPLHETTNWDSNGHVSSPYNSKFVRGNL